MQTITIPAPTISTGPVHMTETEAAEHYLREMASRTKRLLASSGVTALVDRLLGDVTDALATLNAAASTPARVTAPVSGASDVVSETPARVTLTDDEISALVGDDIAFWVGNEFLSREDLLGKVCWWVTRAVAAREDAREAAVRAQIKADADCLAADALAVAAALVRSQGEERVDVIDAQKRHLSAEIKGIHARLRALAARIAGGEQA